MSSHRPVRSGTLTGHRQSEFQRQDRERKTGLPIVCNTQILRFKLITSEESSSMQYSDAMFLVSGVKRHPGAVDILEIASLPLRVL